MQSSVIQHLHKHASGYSFFQWMRLWAQQEHPGELRLSANPSMRCPRSDIEKTETQNGQTRLLLNFMGLYGTTSPLPEAFVQGIHLDQENAQAWRGLLDLFNQRIYQLYFDAWKSRMPMVMLESGHAEWQGRLGQRWQKASLAQLRNWLRQWLGHDEISITPFYPVTIPNPALATLGACSLDGNHFLGLSCKSVLHAVRVVISNVELETVQSYRAATGVSIRKMLGQRLASLLSSPLQICLRIESVLPHDGCTGMGRLGQGSWLGTRNKERLVWDTII